MTSDKPAFVPYLTMFRPPINHAMRVLDRSRFQKRIPTIAAVIQNPRQTSSIKSELWRDTLHIDRLQSIQPIPGTDGKPTGRKALVLKPEIRKDDTSTWSPMLTGLIEASQVELTPYVINLDYDYWSYLDIMSSVLPPDEHEEIPQGFTVVGHVAHVNLRDRYLPYKNLIATVLMDKNPSIRTVINKIDVVGAENPYRTFQYEVLAGVDDLKVETSEENCTFRFDYSKVYWNSRLNTEHRRLVESFQPGEAVADVMAGVGPFAVPAGKKQCFVYANDLNPDSYASLKDALELNKVAKYVRPYNEDGHTFIKEATQDLFHTDYCVETTPRIKAQRQVPGQPAAAPLPLPERTYLHQPKVFSHYILNLPATAITFLPAFIGLHCSRKEYFANHPELKLPMIHVYCFSTKSEDNLKEHQEICQEISRQLGHEMKPGRAGDAEMEDEVQIWDVRDVAPLKRMFCASFRLPMTVAFAGMEVIELANEAGEGRHGECHEDVICS